MNTLKKFPGAATTHPILGASYNDNGEHPSSGGRYPLGMKLPSFFSIGRRLLSLSLGIFLSPFMFSHFL